MLDFDNKKLSGKKKFNIINGINENRIEPMLPEIVLFGLILVNFGPLIDFPTMYPPTSENIHILITNIKS